MFNIDKNGIKGGAAGLALLLCLSASAQAQTPEYDRVKEDAAAAAKANPAAGQPGATWESLASLPDLLNAQWLPVDAPADEAAFLKTMAWPPLQPEYAADAKTAVADMLAGKRDLWTAHCNRDGMPRLAWYPYPLQFMYGAGVVMISEGTVATGADLRAARIGPHPAALTDPNALNILNFNGDSRFTWEGDTLVIDTIAVLDEIDTFYGVLNDPDLHVVERYRLLDHDTLERISVITAPTVFTAPWTVRTTYRRGPAESLATVYCRELPI